MGIVCLTVFEIPLREKEAVTEMARMEGMERIERMERMAGAAKMTDLRTI